MKKIISLVAFTVLCTASMHAQCQNCSDCKKHTSAAQYTRVYTDKKLIKKAAKWAQKGKWKNGFTKALPDSTVNITQFYEQYTKNPEVWKSLFHWLETTDLLAIPAGKTPIAGTDLVASVEDSHNDPLEKRNTESHRKKIDFMYVVRGTEGFARLDHVTSKPNMEYNDKKDVIRYDYEKCRTQFFTNNDGCFNIMFPDDWHIAKVATNEPSQDIRVIVVKMPYKE